MRSKPQGKRPAKNVLRLPDLLLFSHCCCAPEFASGLTLGSLHSAAWAESPVGGTVYKMRKNTAALMNFLTFD